MMRISAIVSVLNCEKFIAQAVESMLAQTRPIDEIIVVNDGSTDNTLSVLNSFGERIQVIDRPHAGAASALNDGLSAATGDMLTFQDADDLWTVDKTDVQTQHFANNTPLDAVFGLVQQFSANDVIPEADVRRIAQPPQPGVSKVAMMIKRNSFNRVGAFDPSLKATEFVEWYARAASVSLRVHTIDRVVAFRRLHDGNTGKLMRDQQAKENIQSLRQLLARRREQT